MASDLPPIGSRVRWIKISGAPAAWRQTHLDGVVVQHVPARVVPIWHDAETPADAPTEHTLAAHAKADFGMRHHATGDQILETIRTADEGKTWERTDAD